MDSKLMRSDGRIVDMLDFAFVRFFAHQYPAWLDARRYLPGHVNAFHKHDFAQMWYCLSGKYLHHMEDCEYECAKGSVVIIPPGVYHRISIPEGEEPELVHLNVMYDTFVDTPPDRYLNANSRLFLPPFADELGMSFPFYIMLSRESQKTVEAYTSWLAMLRFNPPQKDTLLQIYEKLEEMFSLPEFALPEEYRERAVWLIQTRVYPVVRMLAYLNVHYQERITEDALLKEMGICRANLYRHFKRMIGYTYSQYLQMLRVKHVYMYVRFTSYPLAYISDMCGFTDLPHMVRVYEKYMGMAPGRHRKARANWPDEGPERNMHTPKY